MWEEKKNKKKKRKKRKKKTKKNKKEKKNGPGFIFANRFPLFIAVSLSNPSSVVIFNKTNEEKELVFTLRSICPVRFS